MNTQITSVALLVEVAQPLQSGAYSTGMFEKMELQIR